MSKRDKSGRQWRQGVWTAKDQFILLAFLLWQAMVRGIDHIKGLGPDSVDYLLLDAAFSQQLVGYAFVVPAATIIIGMILRLHAMIWIGHSLLVVTYSTVGVSLLVTSVLLFPSLVTLLSLALVVGVGVTLSAMIVTGAVSRLPIAATVLLALMLLLFFLAPEGPDGSLRAPGFYLSIATCHALWAIRMGPSPLPDDDDKVIDEAVVKG